MNFDNSTVAYWHPTGAGNDNQPGVQGLFHEDSRQFLTWALKEETYFNDRPRGMTDRNLIQLLYNLGIVSFVSRICYMLLFIFMVKVILRIVFGPFPAFLPNFRR